MATSNYQSHLSCLACGTTQVDRCFHHVIARKRVAPIDKKWNLMTLCQIHHNEVHQIGLNRFSQKYFSVEKWLIDNDWELDELRGKWINGSASHP
jgi:5-methylcytosine-specific restriction endonuclease McrA